MRRSLLALAVGVAGLVLQVSLQADWTQFRGPAGVGVSQERGLPLRWSTDENIQWKTDLPGAGTSSPVILGDRIFLTCYSGYGLSEESPGQMDDLLRHIVCVDRNSGDVVWHRRFEPELPESEYQGNGARHGYSSSTPASSG